MVLFCLSSFKKLLVLVFLYTAHDAAAALPGTSKTASRSVSLDQGFWFVNMTIGTADVSVLVDTGSSNVAVNPSTLTTSPDYVGLNKSFTLSYGTTESNGGGVESIDALIQQDHADFGGLTVKNQSIGVVQNSTDGKFFPHSGIVGLAGDRFAAPDTTTFFHALCSQELVDECRFGPAPRSNGTGDLIMGKLDNSLVDGNLTIAPIIEEWFLHGDIVFRGKTLSTDGVIELDSGSATITGPTADVSTLFDKIGLQSTKMNISGAETVIAYAPCGSEPPVPDFGFSFPSSGDFSNRSAGLPISPEKQAFHIASSNLFLPPDENAENGKCQFAISGQDFPELPGLWVVGQNFFQGRYIDFNLQDRQIGIANLSNNTSSAPAPASPIGTEPPSSTAVPTSPHVMGMFGIIFASCVLMLG